MNRIELKEFFENTIKNNKIHHSYLFYGAKIEEFEEEILLFLNKIATINKDDETKNKISNQIREGLIQDVKVIDGKDSKVADIRQMFSLVNEKPFIIERKIYVIKNYEFLNQNSQNAMLKILEEPPAYVTIVIMANSITNILDTIKSRCQKYYLTNISNEVTEDIQKYEKDKLNAISNFFKDTLSLDEAIFYSKYSKMIKKNNIEEFLEYLERVIELDPINNSIFIKNIIETKKLVQRNVNFEMVRDQLIFKSLEVAKVKKV